MEFFWGDRDGIPIGLVGFNAKLVFWAPDRFQDSEFMDDRPSEILFAKKVEIKDPHKGIGFVLLSGEDTTRLARTSRTKGIRWGLYLLNDAGDVFPCIVTENGGKWGNVIVDVSSMPDMESVKHA
jgi:hypothetical protein